MTKRKPDLAHPRFDPTINLGHVLTLSAVIVTIIGGAYVFDYRLNAIEKQIEKLQSVFLDTAIVKEQMNGFGKRIDALERQRR